MSFEVASLKRASTPLATKDDYSAGFNAGLEQRFHLRIKRETMDAGRVRAMAASLSAFADLLTKASGRPVIDATGIAGKYDFDLSYRPDLSTPETDERPLLEAALRQRFGLRLERRDMPLEVLIVEQADRTFTEN